MLSANVYKTPDNIDQTFTTLSLQLSSFLQQEGLKTKAFCPGLPHFSVLSIEKKLEIIRHLEFYNGLCVNHQLEREALRDSKTFTWRALMKFGFTPPSDLLNKITDEDVIEIHSEDHIQLFRNFEFFKVCSYTLEQLFCIEWWNLFQRDHTCGMQLLAMVNQLFAGKAPEGFSGNVAQHIVIETLSADRFHINYDLQHVYPLYRNKRVEAIISIVKAHVIS